jgi:ABC-type glutathione transport system ATPase component
MPLLELRRVSKTFARRGAPPQRAVHDVSLTVERGECVALVGESGSGKSTLARLALRLIDADAGEVLFDGAYLHMLRGNALRRARLRMQPVFQDASTAFNPRRTVRTILRQAAAGDSSEVHLCGLLERVELRPAAGFLTRYPSELSGGQRQRLSIARALATGPSLIIADEPLSGADVSVRAQILDLLADLQVESGVSYLLITHDILLARAFSHRIAVMHQGSIVERGDTQVVLHAPAHAYTRRLLDAVQSVDGPVTDLPAG